MTKRKQLDEKMRSAAEALDNMKDVLGDILIEPDTRIYTIETQVEMELWTRIEDCQRTMTKLASELRDQYPLL